MLMSLRNMVIQLKEGRQFAFRGARDAYLECIEGMAWLTQAPGCAHLALRYRA